MSLNYPGNPAGGAGTVPAPGRHTKPTATLPVDLEACNAASVDPTAFEAAMDWLAYLQAQGALGDALGGGATSFDGSANPTSWNDMLTTVGAPVSGLDVLPTFAAGSGFNVTIGAGSGFLNTSVGITPGESAYRSIYWSAQSLAIGTPHASLPRIDVITVTPSAPGTESVLAVVAGTAASTPLAPAVASGSAAILYVLVTPAAGSSTSFRACRAMGRRAPYPFAGLSAIVAGGELSWDIQDPAVASAGLWVGAGDQTGTNMTINRLIIDGEVMEWVGYLTDGGGLVPDTTANPFSGTASANFDKPYYVYACGGRHNPLPSLAASNAFISPVTACESTVPPNPKTGRPTGNLTVNGVTVTPNGAVYIGLGFIVQGTNHRRGCMMDGDMTYSLDRLQAIQHNFTTNGNEDIGTFTGGCQPAISTKVAVNVLFTAPTATDGTVFIRLANFNPLTGFAGVVSGISVGLVPAAKAQVSCGHIIRFTPRTAAELWAVVSSAGFSGSSLLIGAMGFDHRVRRLVAGY